jgi:hypothetical protein
VLVVSLVVPTVLVVPIVLVVSPVFVVPPAMGETPPGSGPIADGRRRWPR